MKMSNPSAILSSYRTTDERRTVRMHTPYVRPRDKSAPEEMDSTPPNEDAGPEISYLASNLPKFYMIRALDLTHSRIGDEGFATICSLVGLQALKLCNNGIEEGSGYLIKLKNLKELSYRNAVPIQKRTCYPSKRWKDSPSWSGWKWRSYTTNGRSHTSVYKSPDRRLAASPFRPSDSTK